MNFRYSIEHCDVENKDSLAKFREKLIEWSDWVSGDHDSSLHRQLTNLNWHDAIFRFFNEARRLITQENRPSGLRNPLLTQMIDRGYVIGQSLELRKIIDGGGRKSLSIPWLLKDIETHLHLFTRENYVCYDGLPYDFESGLAESNKELRAMIAAGQKSGRGLDTHGPKAWSWSQRAHERFDRLSGGLKTSRNRKDVLTAAVLENVRQLIDIAELKDVQKFASKIVAHANERATIGALTETERGVRLEQINKCQNALAKAIDIISVDLIQTGSLANLVPIPQFDPMKHLSERLVPKEHFDRLLQYWKRLEDKDENFEDSTQDETNSS